MKITIYKNKKPNYKLIRQANPQLKNFKLTNADNKNVMYHFSSQSDFYRFITEKIDQECQRIQLLQSKTKKHKLTYLEFKKFLIKYCNLLIDFPKQDLAELYIYNYDYKIYEPLINRINVIINHVNDYLDKQNSGLFLKQLVDSLRNYDQSLYPYRRANFAPQTIIPFKNKIVNRIDDDVSKNYHFRTKLNFNYKTVDECDPILVNLVNKIFDDWSNNDIETKIYLFQIIMAVIEGNGRRKCHIFESSGGNGKSTFGRILSIIAGEQFTVFSNINQYANNNHLNQINMQTKLVFGDDLTSNAKLSGSQMAVIKTLISGGVQQAEVKYDVNRLVQTLAVFLQLTNTAINFYENSSAISDRFIYHYWNSSTNYRANKVLDYNLDKMLGLFDDNYDVDFIEAIIAVAFYYCPTYFEDFTVPTVSKRNMEKVLNESDQVYQFIEHINDLGVLKFESLPLQVMYNYYANFWHKQNNSGSFPMSSKLFNDKFVVHLKKFNFFKEDTRMLMSTLEKQLKFDDKLFREIIDIQAGQNKAARVTVVTNPNNKITDDIINEKINLINQNKITKEDYENDIMLKLLVKHNLNKPKYAELIDFYSNVVIGG